MRDRFIAAVVANQRAFGLEIAASALESLADYYQLVQEHNPLLHLVGPCTPEDFAIRHTLESLILTKYLGPSVRFADVGTGAGLPSIPCLLVREDLSAILIESKIKKTTFLETAVERLGLAGRARVINRQFEEVDPDGATLITCRALDRFTEKLPRLLKWKRSRTAVLFGGPSLKQRLAAVGASHETTLLPLSEQRYLFVVK